MFSVSATKKVQFTGGNLQATIDASGNPTEWKFAANQYEYLGEDGANKTIGIAAGDVDLFLWSTTTDNYGVSNSVNSPYYYQEWGLLFDNMNCRTLSKEEFEYLLNTRTTSTVGGTDNARYAKVKVNSIYGLLIFPDTFEWTQGMGTAPSNVNVGNTVWESVPTYELANFKALEDAGCVFIPAAGYRYQNGVNSIQVLGYVWTSTPGTAIGSVNRVSVNSSGVSVGSCSIDYGCSVRLVTDVD